MWGTDLFDSYPVVIFRAPCAGNGARALKCKCELSDPSQHGKQRRATYSAQRLHNSFSSLQCKIQTILLHLSPAAAPRARYAAWHLTPMSQIRMTRCLLLLIDASPAQAAADRSICACRHTASRARAATHHTTRRPPRGCIAHRDDAPGQRHMRRRARHRRRTPPQLIS